MQTVLLNPYRRAAAALTPGSIDVRATDDGWGYSNGTGYNNGGGQLYTMCNSSKEAWTALLFTMNIPQGAIIDDARLTLYARNNLDWSTAPNHSVGAEQADDPTMLSSGDYASRISAYKSGGSTEVVWNPTGGIGTVTSGNPIEGADIASVIQDIVDRAGWASGQDILLINLAGPASGCFSAHDHTNGTTGLRPRLEVDYRA